uniref:Uncharacterized protein n=1 Tax=Anguilla anguilla TaxID=7936 RepID=A0A0E9TRU8_ANGAN
MYDILKVIGQLQNTGPIRYNTHYAMVIHSREHEVQFTQ